MSRQGVPLWRTGYQGSLWTPCSSRGRQPVGSSVSGISGPVSPSGSSRRGHSSAAFIRGSGHGYRPTDSSSDFDPVVRGPSRTGARGVLSGSDSSRFSVSSPSRVIRGRGHHAERGGIAGVFTGESATDPASGGKGGRRRFGN